MRYITVAEAAKLLLVSDRRVRLLLKQGRIRGCKKWGRDWMIPVVAGTVEVSRGSVGPKMRCHSSEQCKVAG